MFWQIMILLVLLIPLVAIILDSSVGKAMASRLESGRPGSDAERIVRRIRTLESEVDRLSTQVDRLEEESDFLHELLSQRSPGVRSGDRTLPSSEEDPTLRAGDDED